MTAIVRAKIGILFSAMVLVVAIVAMFLTNGSLGWFASNRQVGSNGFQITAISNAATLEATLESYPVISITEASGVITYTPNYSVQSTALPRYDPADVAYSEYKKALMLKLTVTAVTDPGNYDFIVHRKTGSTLTAAVNNYFSNATRITPVALVTGESDTFTRASSAAYTALTSFATGNQGATETDATIAEDLPVTQGATFYYVIEYNSDFMDYLTRYYATHEMVQEITYQNDIYFTLE